MAEEETTISKAPREEILAAAIIVEAAAAVDTVTAIAAEIAIIATIIEGELIMYFSVGYDVYRFGSCISDKILDS